MLEQSNMYKEHGILVLLKGCVFVILLFFFVSVLPFFTMESIIYDSLFVNLDGKAFYTGSALKEKNLLLQKQILFFNS